MIFKKKTVADILFRLQGGNGVVDAAGVVGYWQGTVKRANHLRQATGFIA